MKFDKYYSSLTILDRKAYALRVGSSDRYIRRDYLGLKKTPKISRMYQLAAATEGKCSYRDILNFFMLKTLPDVLTLNKPQGEDHADKINRNSSVV